MRRFCSFLVRGWAAQPGDGAARVEVEHVDSGSRVVARSFSEAAAWMERSSHRREHGMTTQEGTVVNGIDVATLGQTIEAIRDDPGIAQFTFKPRTEWQHGTTSRAEISSFTHAGQEVQHKRTHTLMGCEPELLVGNDSGPNAVELALAALGFCYSVGFVANAAAKGYQLEEMSYEVEGDLDLRSFVGVEGGPRPGFTEIRVKGRAKARNASAEELQQLCGYVQDTSPVKDILAHAVPVKTSLEVVST